MQLSISRSTFSCGRMFSNVNVDNPVGRNDKWVEKSCAVGKSNKEFLTLKLGSLTGKWARNRFGEYESVREEWRHVFRSGAQERQFPSRAGQRHRRKRGEDE